MQSKVTRSSWFPCTIHPESQVMVRGFAWYLQAKLKAAEEEAKLKAEAEASGHHQR